jgi:hypothetical protein
MQLLGQGLGYKSDRMQLFSRWVKSHRYRPVWRRWPRLERPPLQSSGKPVSPQAARTKPAQHSGWRKGSEVAQGLGT